MQRILSLILLGACVISAQAPRPRIGLVLEGGGALGFAHIGVLQWLEEHRIPVDYVAGTSMGGLIGGLYASGQKPEEIRNLARDIDWDRTLSGQVGMRDLSYRRKEDRIDYPNRLLFGLKGGLDLPTGLNDGHEIGLILDRAALPYYDLKSFDDLPIPFRCVATEMVSGKQTIFDRGSLAAALRSTMSIPAVFSPVKDDGKLYTDGGALDNLPVDVAKAMGAEVIIAVYLDQGASDPKNFNSLLGAAGRNIEIMIAANELRSMQEADILLSADLKGYTSADFSKSEEIWPKGVAAAKKKAALLDRLALNEADWKAYMAAREAKRRTNIPTPAFVAVNVANPVLRSDMEKTLRKYVGKPLDPSLLESDLRALHGFGDFDSLGYAVAAQDSKQGLAIRAVENSLPSPYLNLGVNVDGTDTNDIRFGLSARVTFANLGGYRSELRADGFFGANNGLRAEYFHPFNPRSRWFIAPRAYTTNQGFEVYENRQRISQYRVADKGFGADLGYSLSHRAEIRVGQALDWQSDRLAIGQVLAPNGANRRGITALHFRYFGQDDALVPHSGLIAQSDVSYFSHRPNGDGYTSATARLSAFQPIHAKGTLFATGAFGTAFGAKSLGGNAFGLGGPLSLGAFGRNELLGNQFYLTQGGYIRELFRLSPLIGDALYAVGFYELGKVYGPLLPNTPKNPQDGSVMFVMKTLIGPAFVGGSVGEGGRAKWYFGLGKVF